MMNPIVIPNFPRKNRGKAKKKLLPSLQATRLLGAVSVAGPKETSLFTETRCERLALRYTLASQPTAPSSRSACPEIVSLLRFFQQRASYEPLFEMQSPREPARPARFLSAASGIFGRPFAARRRSPFGTGGPIACGPFLLEPKSRRLGRHSKRFENRFPIVVGKSELW
jgi:hypothetical protein